MNFLLSLALWLSAKHTSLALAIANTRYKLLTLKTRISRQGDMYVVTESLYKQYVPNLLRAIYVYRNGITERLNQIKGAYCLDRVEIKINDTILDCGANFGDFSLAVTSQSNHTPNLYLFEPSFDEYRCLKISFPTSQVKQIALADFSGIKTFFLSTESGDSSLYEPAGGYQSETEVRVETLDNLNLPDGPIKILKVEAEGGEPEVILGAKRLLERVEYVALDGGAERGRREISTWQRCLSLLERQGFILVAMSATRKDCGILRNTKFLS